MDTKKFKMKNLLFLIIGLSFNICISQNFNDLKEFGWNGKIKEIKIKYYDETKILNGKIKSINDWSMMQIYYINSNSNIDSIYDYFDSKKTNSKRVTAYHYLNDKNRINKQTENKILKSNISEVFINEFEYESIEQDVLNNLTYTSIIKLNKNYRMNNFEIKGIDSDKLIIVDEKEQFMVNEKNLCFESTFVDNLTKNTTSFFNEFFDFDDQKNFKKSIRYKLLNNKKIINRITLREIKYY